MTAEHLGEGTPSQSVPFPYLNLNKVNLYVTFLNHHDGFSLFIIFFFGYLFGLEIDFFQKSDKRTLLSTELRRVTVNLQSCPLSNCLIGLSPYMCMTTKSLVTDYWISELYHELRYPWRP